MIAIIGGSGFIGSRLASLFELNEKPFVIIDKKNSALFNDKYRYGDVTKPNTLGQVLRDCSIIINLAAEHKDNVHPTSLYYDVNVQGAKNVCDVADQLGIKHIVFTSSVAVYGFVEKETGKMVSFIRLMTMESQNLRRSMCMMNGKLRVLIVH